MAFINGLYMEDHLEDYKNYGAVLERIWRSNESLCSLGELKLDNLDYVDSPLKALEMLRQRGEQYTIFIADLLFLENPSDPKSALTPSGLSAVTEATDLYDRIVVVAISVAEQEKHWAGIKEKFLSAGGHVYFSKPEITYTTDYRALYIDMGKKIEEVFRKKGLLAGIETGINLQPDQNDSVTAAMVETVGALTVKRLLRQLAPECKDFRYAYISPGQSGALVFKIIASPIKQPQGTKRYLLLKVTKDSLALKKEIDRRPPPGTLSSGTYPELVKSEPVEADGWSAICYALLTDAVTLHSWLLDEKPNSKDVCTFLESLFNELAKLYKDRSFKDNMTALDILFPSKVMNAHILALLEQLWVLVEHFVMNNQPDRKVINDFLKERKMGCRPVESIPFGTVLSDCHGDLHGRNILLHLQNRMPYLIDFSEREKRLWGSDFAKLAADLFIGVWDYGPESYKWSKLKSWRNIFRNWLFDKSNNAYSDEVNASIWSCLVWIRDNLERICLGGDQTFGFSTWQFELALAIEFIKITRQPNIPPPKSVLAILVFYDIVKELEDKIPKRR